VENSIPFDKKLKEWLKASSPLLRPQNDTCLAEPFLNGNVLETKNNAAEGLNLADKDQRLGRRFERLTHDVLHELVDLDLLAGNIILHDGSRTIGELDLVTYDRQRDRYQHWEMTLKFYLGISTDHWPGPNPIDNLHRKANRLFGHQFPLSASPLAQARLQALNIPRIDERVVLSRGTLFYPAEQSIKAPEIAHPNHHKGRWWTLSQLPTDTRWQPLSRNDWIGTGSVSDKGTSMLATNQLVDYVQSAPSPLMVIAYHHTNALPEPGFIVSDNWLVDARDARKRS
jgi:hypothetical protein